MKRGLHSLIFLFIFTISGVAQNYTLQRANLLYSQKAYAEAIPLYEKLMNTPDSGGVNSLVLSKLGDCYRLTNNLAGQLLCYGNLVEKGEASPIQELYYAEALLQNGEGDKAKVYFEKYSADERGSKRASALRKVSSYSRNMDAYVVNPINFNSPQSDFCAVKFKDEVVFVSSRNRGEWIKREHGWTNENLLSIYITQANENGQQTIKPLPGALNSKSANDGPICFNQDFTKAFFTRNNESKEDMAKDSSYKLCLYEASLEQTGFTNIHKLPFVNKEYNYAHPSVTPDGYTLYFASDMEGGFGGMDIYVTHKDSSGVWTTPENLGDKINTAGNEVFPFISSNNVLYFSSNGHDGIGGLDIYEVSYKDGQIQRAYNMGEPVNSNLDDFGIFLNEDNKTGYISSNRQNGGVDDDIYDLLILRQVKRDKDLLIITKDKYSNLPVPNTTLTMNGSTIITNEKGEYRTSIEEGASLKFYSSREGYYDTQDSLITANSLNESFTKEIIIEKDPKPFLQALVTDVETGNPLEGVSIRITDIMTGESFNPYITSASGTYYKFLSDKKIGDQLTYLVRLDKEGYMQRSIIFTYEIVSEGEINMNKVTSMTLGKVEIGMDLAKMIQTKPIYFDLGKSSIQQDAATELDKIVQVMNEYPNMVIELGAHTDCRSKNRSSNLKLSQARAEASMDYIIKRGINKSRISAKGYGDTKPVSNCECKDCTEEEHAKNRRTEFIIVKLE